MGMAMNIKKKIGSRRNQEEMTMNTENRRVKLGSDEDEDEEQEELMRMEKSTNRQ